MRFHSSVWSGPQRNYSTVKKEILAIVLCIQKFQSNVFNKKFLLRVDCKSVKEILQKDVQNLVSKKIFARWQAILYLFDFEIKFIKGNLKNLNLKNQMNKNLTRKKLDVLSVVKKVI